MSPAIPPSETPEQLREALLRNHPELTAAEVDALLTGEPAARRRAWQADRNWHRGTRGPTGGAPVVRAKRGRTRLQHRDGGT